MFFLYKKYGQLLLLFFIFQIFNNRVHQSTASSLQCTSGRAFSASNRTRDQPYDESPPPRPPVVHRCRMVPHGWTFEILRVDKRDASQGLTPLVPGRLCVSFREQASRRYIYIAADASDSRLLHHQPYWKVMFDAKTGSFNKSRFPRRDGLALFQAH